MTILIEVSKVLGCAIGLFIGSVAIFSSIIALIVVTCHQTFNFNGKIGTDRGHTLIGIMYIDYIQLMGWEDGKSKTTQKEECFESRMHFQNIKL